MQVKAWFMAKFQIRIFKFAEFKIKKIFSPLQLPKITW